MPRDDEADLRERVAKHMALNDQLLAERILLVLGRMEPGTCFNCNGKWDAFTGVFTDTHLCLACSLERKPGALAELRRRAIAEVDAIPYAELKRRFGGKP